LLRQAAITIFFLRVRNLSIILWYITRSEQVVLLTLQFMLGNTGKANSNIVTGS